MEVGGLIPPVPPDNFSEPKLKHIMKVELNENKEVNERPFPKLMKARLSLNVVYFRKDKEGIVLTGFEPYREGHYSNDWNMSEFQDFNGSITLSNE